MEFKDAAARFCEVIEAAESYDRENFVTAVVPRLADLIAAAAAMQSVVLPEGEDYDCPSISLEDWRERFRAVGHVLGDWDIYWVLDPLAIDDGEADPEVMAGDLNDDLADIWRDLKAGLRGLEAGGPEVSIRWEWRWGFYNHWGEHATAALGVLHARKSEMYYRPRPSSA
ncbi:MAG: DUF5063 domain-containing protein [Nocardioides sp.]|nr:DUF5063 domain-containing protein [Nocardioides sp.]